MTKQEQKDQAWKKYKAITDLAWKKYEAIIDLAWKNCLAKYKKIDEQEEDK